MKQRSWFGRLIGFFFILSLTSHAGACSVASPFYYHINRLVITDDPDILIVEVQEFYSQPTTRLAYSISENEIRSGSTEGYNEYDLSKIKVFGMEKMYREINLETPSSNDHVSYLDESSGINYKYDITPF